MEEPFSPKEAFSRDSLHYRCGYIIRIDYVNNDKATVRKYPFLANPAPHFFAPGDPDLRAYRYNKTSTLDWLKQKVDRVTQSLQDTKCQLSGAQVSSFVKSSKGTAYSQGITAILGLQCQSRIIKI